MAGFENYEEATRKIEHEMNVTIARQRDKWIEEFLQRIQTRGQIGRGNRRIVQIDHQRMQRGLGAILPHHLQRGFSARAWSAAVRASCR